MFWPFARPDYQHRPIVETLFGVPCLARIVTVRDAVRVDSRPAPTTFGDGTHDHNLGPLQVARINPRGLERQRDETVGSTLRASRHDRLMMSLPADARACGTQCRVAVRPCRTLRCGLGGFSRHAGTRCARGRRRLRSCRTVATQCTCRKRAASPWPDSRSRRNLASARCETQRQSGVGSTGSWRRRTT